MKVSLFFFSALFLGIALLPQAWAQDSKASKVVVTVGSETITASDIEEVFQSMYGRRAASLNAQQRVAFQREAKAAIKEQLIAKLLLANAAREAKMPVKEGEITEAIEKVKQTLPRGVTLDQHLKSVNWTVAKLRSEILQDLQINKLVARKTALVKAATEAELKTFYKENAENYDTPETVKARHILVSAAGDEAGAKTKIKELRKQLVDKKADFAQLAQTHSDCPSKAMGGDLGEFGRGKMVPAFDKVAFTAEPGAISDVIQTKFGFHIIQVLEHKDSKLSSFEGVKARIGRELLEEKKRKVVGDYVDTLRKKLKVVEKP